MAPAARPLRTAIIGLSADAATSWAGQAHLPYLLSPRGRARFAVVALCNSSVAAARRAIAAFGLAPETRAYGDARQLAADAAVDLVVCCTRVDVHLETVLPSVRAGRAVYVEWPLAHDAAAARELAAAAAASGARAMVGLQGRVAPPVVALRRLLAAGRVGRVLSAEVRAAGGTLDRHTLSAALRYFTDLAVGGNIVTIGFGHLLDQVQHVLGDLDGLEARLQLQRPEVRLRDAATGEPGAAVRSNVPDLVVATGTLAASPWVREGATVLVRYRRGQPFPGEPGLAWTIHGDEGEARLVARGGPTLQSSTYAEPVTVEVHDYANDEVHAVPWAWEDWQAELPVVARSVAALYERFAAGESVPSFEDAARRHAQLQHVLRAWPPASGQDEASPLA